MSRLLNDIKEWAILTSWILKGGRRGNLCWKNYGCLIRGVWHFKRNWWQCSQSRMSKGNQKCKLKLRSRKELDHARPWRMVFCWRTQESIKDFKQGNNMIRYVLEVITLTFVKILRRGMDRSKREWKQM